MKQSRVLPTFCKPGETFSLFCPLRPFYLPSGSAIHVSVCSLSVTVENWNFSAVRSPIGLKLGGDLGLVSQISMHVWVSRFDCFLGSFQESLHVDDGYMARWLDGES
jgi:hypothetical protein